MLFWDSGLAGWTIGSQFIGHTYIHTCRIKGLLSVLGHRGMVHNIVIATNTCDHKIIKQHEKAEVTYSGEGDKSYRQNAAHW